MKERNLMVIRGQNNRALIAELFSNGDLKCLHRFYHSEGKPVHTRGYHLGCLPQSVSLKALKSVFNEKFSPYED